LGGVDTLGQLILSQANSLAQSAQVHFQKFLLDGGGDLLELIWGELFCLDLLPSAYGHG